MANSEAGTGSDAAQASRGEYEVFLSFRGPDTRHEFTDFLYHGLVDAGVRVFKDDTELRKGEVISKKLRSAIKKSKLYVPVFSQTYASSKWCLLELTLMVNNVSMSKGEKTILPIFLDVEPADLKLYTPLYKNAFRKHKQRDPNKVKVWTNALAKVAEISGWNVKKDQSKAEIVKLVVGEVSERLKIKEILVTEHLVGLDDRVKRLTEFLDVNHRDVRLIAIYGMGGMGKTTIAQVIFNLLRSHFGKCCSFLENVRERSSTKEDIVRLQKKLLFDIVGSRSIDQFDDWERGKTNIEEILRTKKVLLVLDDVADDQHIKNLLRTYSFYSGSRIIVTTRDQTIPTVEGFKGEILRYEMQKMDNGPALKLFCRHAFNEDLPPDDYRERSNKIVSGIGGLPLAIQVIGSLLKRRDEALWKETSDNLKNASEGEILKKLRISYDDLDSVQKIIFLDIASCFVNEKKSEAIYMWSSCQLKPVKGIKVLTERCLIKILDNDLLWMHDQLIALGRQIVRDDSRGNLGKQSRLWIAEEARVIIRNAARKNKVQGLEIDGLDDSIEITNEEFQRLENLRFLKLHNGTYSGDFAKCSSNLRWFSWHSYPLTDFRADNLDFGLLVVCKLDDMHFKDDSNAWDWIKRARNLKVLSITRCPNITKMPDIYECLALERLTVANCYRLKTVESFIGCLRSLIELKIENCNGLANLPEEVGALVKLKHFSLKGCRGLGELPNSIGNLTSLTKLNLSSTGIAKLPNSIEGLVKLESFLLRNTRLSEIPNSIGKLTSLRILSLRKNGSYHQWHDFFRLPSGINTLVNLEELDLFGRDGLVEIPNEIGNLSSLKILNLEGTDIGVIPRTVCRLHRLQTLNLLQCYLIRELPELPTSLTCLLLQSTSLFSIPDLSNLTNLVELHLKCGSQDRGVLNLNPECNLSWIGSLSILKKLHLYLIKVRAPRELASLSHLEELTLNGLDLETLLQLPSSQWSLRNLSTLELHGCEVEDIQLDKLPRLKKLTIDNCERLRRLSISLELRKPSQVRVASCLALVEIQVVDLTKSLESLSVLGYESLTRIGGLSCSKNLENLYIHSCKSLRRLIDASCTNIPDDCLVNIQWCGDFIKASSPAGMPMKGYREEILLDTSNKVDTEWEEDYGEEMMEMFREEWTTKTNVHSEEAGGEWKVVGSVEARGNRRHTKVGWTGTRCASKPGRDPAERGRARSMTSSSRDSKGLRSDRDAASTSGKSTASNSGRGIASSSRSSTTLSSGRGRVSTSGMGTASNSGRGTASSSQSSTTLSSGRGRVSTLGIGMAKMGASLRSGTDKGSSSAKAEPKNQIHDKNNMANTNKQ
ncbi:disease resistance protein L6-like [Rhodamnia argentea]|uniref:Disease resistance protein L6-like n=1 Tax=Rhodamnia argentea TaxID=178133 RepID=A0ABM3HBL4_9MYRT|nr:disease resistance protein L6-like [Rhodamnia argentea]